MSVALKYDGYFTYEDYVNWDESERWELIDGVPYAMASPGLKHQEVLFRLARKFADFADTHSKCRVIIAPFSVRLNANDKKKSDDTVLEPDIIVVCDPKKLADGKSVKGAPDVVVEILSPSTMRHDRLVKFAKYREAKVREIWFVDPANLLVDTFTLHEQSGEYISGFLEEEGVVHVRTLDGLALTREDIFGIQEEEILDGANTIA